MRKGFIATEVGAGLRRNLTMTVAMILTTAISLAMFGGGLLVVKVADNSKQIFLSRVEVQVYLDEAFSAKDPECTQKACQDLSERIKKIQGVNTVTYISRKQAVEDATERVFAHQQQFQQLVKGIGLPASFKIKVDNTQQIDNVIAALTPYPPGVNGINDQRELVNKIFNVLNSVRNSAFLIAILQAIAAILLMINTIQMAAFSRRTEVSIMSLVGATRWYRQLPFIVETLFSALIGAVLAIIGIIGVKEAFLSRFLDNAGGLKQITDFSIMDVLVISPWILLTGATLAIVTSYVTLRLYVKD